MCCKWQNFLIKTLKIFGYNQHQVMRRINCAALGFYYLEKNKRFVNKKLNEKLLGPSFSNKK